MTMRLEGALRLLSDEATAPDRMQALVGDEVKAAAE